MKAMKINHFSQISLLVLLFGAFIGCQKFDTLMLETQVKTITFSQADLIKAFSGLTENNSSACNLILDNKTIPDVLCKIVAEAREGSEIVFAVDKTGSMADDIEEVKNNINKIIDCLPKGCRLGALAYGDNRADGRNWYSSMDLTEDYTAVRKFINSITVVGGGDIPESVYDALWKCLNEMSWKDCKAPDKIIVMGDAPPKTGSGTDHTVEEVLAKAKSLCPGTKFYPVIVL
jgi:von Willebrand factor type A domain